MKKIMALILSSLILLMSVTCTAEENLSEETTPYTASSAELEAVEILKGFGVLDNGFASDEIITRAEFTSLLIRAIEKDTSMGAFVPFADVDEKSEYFAPIATAFSLGIIASADLFNPDMPILTEQAYKMLVVSLGYNLVANASGGWSAGYGAVASKLSLGKGANAVYGEPLYGATAACLVLNTLKAPVFVQTAYGADERYEEKRGSVYMSEFLDIYEGEGVVTGNALTDLEGLAVNDDSVRIDSIKYFAGTSSAGLYLGQKAVFYYRKGEDDSFPTILYASPKKNANEITEIDATDVDKSATTAKKIVYTNNEGLKKEIELSPSVDVVYNGESVFGYNKYNLTPDTGNVTVIDNNGDKKADVVIVRNYRIAIVHSADDTLNAIYMKLGAQNVYFDDYDGYILSKDGKSAKISDIKEWDIACVAENGKNAEIMISSASVSGTISELEKDGGIISEIKIDGEWYGVSNGYIEKSAELRIGLSGVFFKAIDGRIAASKIYTTEKPNYAILTGAKKKDSGVSDKVSVQFFTQDNETVTMETAEHLIINNKSVKRDNIVENLSAALYELVVIDADTDGKLTEIQTPVDITNIDGHIGYDEENFSLDRNFASVRFMSVFGGCWMTADTLFFSIPTDKSNIDLYRCENAKSKLGSSDVTYKNIKVYDLDRFNNAAVIIYSDFDAEMSADNPEVDLWNEFFVISSVKTALDAEGTERKKVSGYFEGKYTEYFVADGGAQNVTEMWRPDQGRMDNQVGKRGRSKWGFAGYTDDDFEIGDVIQPELDAKGRLKYFRMLYSAKLGGVDVGFAVRDGNYIYGGDDLVYYKQGDFYEINELGPTQHHKDDPGYITMCYTALGRVTDSDGSIFRFDTCISMNTGGAIETYNVNRVMQGIKYFYIFSPSKKTVKEASATDLKIGDKIFVHSKGYVMIIRD